MCKKCVSRVIPRLRNRSDVCEFRIFNFALVYLFCWWCWWFGRVKTIKFVDFSLRIKAFGESWWKWVVDLLKGLGSHRFWWLSGVLWCVFFLMFVRSGKSRPNNHPGPPKGGQPPIGGRRFRWGPQAPMPALGPPWLQRVSETWKSHIATGVLMVWASKAS